MLDKILRRLPTFRGKYRVMKFLYGQMLKSTQEILLEGKYSCKYFLPNLTENVGLDIFINGIYEEETVNFLNRIIPPNGKFMDIGANIGAISIPLSKRRGDIQVLAVEAAPWIFEYLEKNVSVNQLRNISLVNNAVFDTDNVEMDFFSPREKYGKGSLSPVFSQDGIKILTRQVDTIIREYSFESVNTLKVDVEGFEHFVFKGALNLLKSDNPPDIVFEFVDWAEGCAMNLLPGSAQQLLLDLGYDLFQLKGNEIIKLNGIMTKGSANLFASQNASKRLLKR